MKSATISLRLSKADYDWLRQNATETSSFVRKLVQDARRNEEERPLEVRINETRKLLKEQENSLEAAKRNAWSDTEEVQAQIRFLMRTVQRLKAKLAMLERLKV